MPNTRILDSDRLNNILFAQRLDQQIINLIANALGNHSFFVGGEPLPIALIERTDRDWQWAKDWTKTTLELLKKLSLTFILTDGYLNGSAYGFDPEYTADLPNSLNLGAFPETVSVRVPRGQRVSVTYLERAHSVPSAPYCSQVVNKISCWMLRYREFSAPNSEDLVVEIDAREILFNSMVLSKGGSLNKGGNLLLYSNLVDTLERIYNSLRISDCKVVTRLTAVLNRTYAYQLDPSLSSMGHFSCTAESVAAIDPIFFPVPSAYDYAYLKIGDNFEYGFMTAIFYQNNNSVEFAINKPPLSFFDIWQKGLVESAPLGYELNEDPFSNKFLEVLSYSVPLTEIKPVSFSTFKNNIRLDLPWSFAYPRVFTSFPPMTRTQLGGWYRPFEFKTKVIGEDSILDFPSFNGNYYDAFRGRVAWQVGQFNGGEPGQYRPDLSPGEPTGVFGLSTRFDISPQATAVGLMRDDDMNLFSNGDIAILQADLHEITEGYFYEVQSYGDFPEFDNYVVPNYQSYLKKTLHERRLKVKFSLNYSPNLESVRISDSAELEHGQVAEINASVVTPEGVGDLVYPPAINEPILVSCTVMLNRDLGLYRGDRPTLIIVPANQSPPVPPISYFGREGLNLLETLTSTFDPDPDNGDIMPDSKRLIEIHEALEADTYAIDGKNRRVANLGWLINKMAHVLGLHFAPDGRMAKPPDTKHYKDGDTIPENWQMGQFGKNKWKDKKGTWHDGVGIAYEVRSNSFGVDGFTGKDDAIEEGGWVTCNSLVQLLDTKFDDDDRAFGLQDLGANVLPSPDGNRWIAYQGLHALLQEAVYMLAAISDNTSHTQVLAMKNNALAMENLSAHGVPIEIKEIEANIGGTVVKIPIPGVAEGAPTHVDLAIWILSNLAPILASSFAVKGGE
jgi:hypothetical protein